MKQVILYTDGACSGNPGAGGWCAILEYSGREKELSGFEKETTNNRMELTAAIKGLEALKEPCEVKLHSDSSYLVDAFEKGWLEKWKHNGWMRDRKSQVKNIDLWQRLDELSAIHKIIWVKVKGHSDDEMNKRCDKIAVETIKNNMAAGLNPEITTQLAEPAHSD